MKNHILKILLDTRYFFWLPYWPKSKYQDYLILPRNQAGQTPTVMPSQEIPASQIWDLTLSRIHVKSKNKHWNINIFNLIYQNVLLTHYEIKILMFPLSPPFFWKSTVSMKFGIFDLQHLSIEMLNFSKKSLGFPKILCRKRFTYPFCPKHI